MATSEQHRKRDSSDDGNHSPVAVDLVAESGVCVDAQVVRIDVPPGDRIPACPAPELLGFVGAAVASGVIGNLAYDIGRRVVDAAWERFHTQAMHGETELDDLAIHAVVDLARRRHIHVAAGELRRVHWVSVPTGLRGVVCGVNGAIYATVNVLIVEGRMYDCEVIIWNQS